MMRREITYKYIAFDGTEFIGDDAFHKCYEYEQMIIRNIKIDMDRHVDIHNVEFLLGENNNNCFIRFNSKKGKSLFREWCHRTNIPINLDNLGNKKINECYRIVGLGVRYAFVISDDTIEDELNNFIETHNHLHSLGYTTLRIYKENIL